jgi:hypothetical protein
VRLEASHKRHITKLAVGIGSSITAHCLLSSILTMERLFSSCSRLRDLIMSQDRLERFRNHHPELWQELNLDGSTEDLLSAERAFTYADLYALLGNENMVVWLTPHAAVMPESGRGIYPWRQVDGSCRIRFKADGKVIDALARSREHLSEICDVVLRLLAASAVHSVVLDEWSSRDIRALTNAASLAYLMERCQSLKTLMLVCLELDESHCRVLGVHSRPDLEIVLDSCTFTSAGTSALVEVFGRNQGPTELYLCYLDNFVLANGLRRNSRLKSLRLRFSNCREVGNQEVLAIAAALRENKGLVDLDLNSCWVSDETWGAVCDSLKTHPTLEVLGLSLAYTAGTLTPAVIPSRIQSLLDMMKVNISIHTIRLLDRYANHELYRESVIPFLETNRLRQRVRAIQKTCPITLRAKVLGRALLSARTDPNRFWMLLSGNAEVTLPAATITTTPAIASLPTSVTAATAIRAASTASASAAANVVAPVSGQKRKTWP